MANSAASPRRCEPAQVGDPVNPGRVDQRAERVGGLQEDHLVPVGDRRSAARKARSACPSRPARPARTAPPGGSRSSSRRCTGRPPRASNSTSASVSSRSARASRQRQRAGEVLDVDQPVEQLAVVGRSGLGDHHVGRRAGRDGAAAAPPAAASPAACRARSRCPAARRPAPTAAQAWKPRPRLASKMPNIGPPNLIALVNAQTGSPSSGVAAGDSRNSRRNSAMSSAGVGEDVGQPLPPHLHVPVLAARERGVPGDDGRDPRLQRQPAMPAGQLGEHARRARVSSASASAGPRAAGPLGRAGQVQVGGQHRAQVRPRPARRARPGEQVVDAEREDRVVHADQLGQEVRGQPGQRQVQAAVQRGQRPRPGPAPGSRRRRCRAGRSPDSSSPAAAGSAATGAGCPRRAARSAARTAGSR